MMATANETKLSVLPEGASVSEHCRRRCFWIVLRADIKDMMSSDFLWVGGSFVV